MLLLLSYHLVMRICKVPAISVQAYRLFLAGKSPIDVADTLNLTQVEVTEFYKEYWNLCHLHDLHQIYKEIRLTSFFIIYSLITNQHLTNQHLTKRLKESSCFFVCVFVFVIVLVVAFSQVLVTL